MSARYYEAVGRRKTSSARVRLYPGSGHDRRQRAAGR